MKRHLLTLVLVFLMPVFTAAGCEESAVGDPCVPEANITLDADESTIELSSVQCATRVCLVHELAGNPKKVIGDSPDCALADPEDLEDECVTADELNDKVYCSCRCGAPAGSSVPTCDCPGGFHCEEILQSGGDGIRGDYCVRND